MVVTEPSCRRASSTKASTCPMRTSPFSWAAPSAGGNTCSASAGSCGPGPANKRSPTSSSRRARSTTAARERARGALLPRNLLAYGVAGGRVLPHYLGESDEPWVRELIDELDALVGRTQGDADRILAQRLRALSLEHRVPFTA